MLTKIKDDMMITLALKDGTTEAAIVDVLAKSVLTRLETPSEAVMKAGSETLYRMTGHVVPYEIMGQTFAAQVREAAKP